MPLHCLTVHLPYMLGPFATCRSDCEQLGDDLIKLYRLHAVTNLSAVYHLNSAMQQIQACMARQCYMLALDLGISV